MWSCLESRSHTIHLLHISHNVPFPYPLMHHFITNLHVCTFLLQHGALWDICLMNRGIGETLASFCSVCPTAYTQFAICCFKLWISSVRKDDKLNHSLTLRGAWYSNELQWLDLKIGNHGNSPSNAHQVSPIHRCNLRNVAAMLVIRYASSQCLLCIMQRTVIYYWNLPGQICWPSRLPAGAPFINTD